VIILLTLNLIGCASSPPVINTTATIFQGASHNDRDTIAVLPIDDSQKSSLEFRNVAEYLGGKFNGAGYNYGSGNPKFIAYVTYGIDDGKTSYSSVPLFGQTGGGTNYSSGTVATSKGIGTFSTTNSSMPTYGVVGSMPVSQTTYKRVVNIDVYRASPTPTKVYEIRATSLGSCGNMNVVLYKIIDSVFVKFPGENGKPRNVTLPFNLQDCR